MLLPKLGGDGEDSSCCAALAGAVGVDRFLVVDWSGRTAAVGAGDGPSVYSGVLDGAGLDALLASGVDRHEIEVTASPTGQFEVEVILSGAQADAARRAGADLAPQDSAAARRTTALAAPVFRPVQRPGGIQEELVAQAAAHPAIAELEVIGQTVQGKDISAVRVTTNVAGSHRRPAADDGVRRRPARREWITPEMVRRLLDHVPRPATAPTRGSPTLVDTPSCGSSPSPTPTATTSRSRTGQRLWRKNLRDNNGDGEITAGDGVDLNRNYPTRWGYDNEGSSPNPASETYRGPSPASEPETQALDALFADITPEFLVNYHSAAELLLYGIGWQVATPSPDDVIYEAMVGDDAEPRRPGLRPRHLGRAVHDQRRHRLAHAGGVRHARVHARDVDVRGGVGRRSRRRSGRPRTARAASTSPTTRR